MLLLRAGCEIYSFLAAAEKLRACQTQAVDTLNRHWAPKVPSCTLPNNTAT